MKLLFVDVQFFVISRPIDEFVAFKWLELAAKNVILSSQLFYNEVLLFDYVAGNADVQHFYTINRVPKFFVSFIFNVIICEMSQFSPI